MSLKSMVFGTILSLVGVSAMAEIIIHDAYARSASPRAKSGAAFLHIMNTGGMDDRLIAVLSDAAQRIELHTHVMENDMAMMMQIEGGIVVPAGGIAMLDRGGDHVMMMGLTAPFVQGEGIPMTFVFENAGEITLDVVIDSMRMPDDVDHSTMDHTAHD